MCAGDRHLCFEAEIYQAATACLVPLSTTIQFDLDILSFLMHFGVGRLAVPSGIG